MSHPTTFWLFGLLKKVFLTDTPWHKSDTWFCFHAQNYTFSFKNLSLWFVLKISYHQVMRMRIISNTWHILCQYNTIHITLVLGFSDVISTPPFWTRFILTLSRSTTSGCYFISMLVSTELGNFILILQPRYIKWQDIRILPVNSNAL